MSFAGMPREEAIDEIKVLVEAAAAEEASLATLSRRPDAIVTSVTVTLTVFRTGGPATTETFSSAPSERPRSIVVGAMLALASRVWVTVMSYTGLSAVTPVVLAL